MRLGERGGGGGGEERGGGGRGRGEGGGEGRGGRGDGIRGKREKGWEEGRGDHKNTDDERKHGNITHTSSACIIIPVQITTKVTKTFRVTCGFPSSHKTGTPLKRNTRVESHTQQWGEAHQDKCKTAPVFAHSPHTLADKD